MIPTIEDIIEGMEAGMYSKEQAIARLHQYSEHAKQSLRDDFAIAAEMSGQCPHNQHEHDACAVWNYDRADAMLAVRSQK